MVDWLKSVIQQYGMKGMSVWKLKDLDSTGVTIECLENMDVSCVASAPMEHSQEHDTEL